MLALVEASPFDEEDFFRAIEGSGARVLPIGRRALVALGAPLHTADHDLRAHVDDIERLIAWFHRQYSTAGEQLAYVRRKAAERLGRRARSGVP